MSDEQKDVLSQNETDSQATVQEATSPNEAANGSQQNDYNELNNRYLRLAADFDNFRKRQAQEREHLFKYGAQSTLESLLPVLDNLERARQSLNENSDPKMLYKSFELLSQQLLDSLQNIGLAKMTPKGEVFDPELHEAISQVEREDVPDLTIVEVYQDGYRLHDRVLRPAQVVVSVMPEVATAKNEPNFEPTQLKEKKNPFQQTPSGRGNKNE